MPGYRGEFVGHHPHLPWNTISMDNGRLSMDNGVVERGVRQDESRFRGFVLRSRTEWTYYWTGDAFGLRSFVLARSFLSVWRKDHPTIRQPIITSFVHTNPWPLRAYPRWLLTLEHVGKRIRKRWRCRSTTNLATSLS
jgi:hypothetical protein